VFALAALSDQPVADKNALRTKVVALPLFIKMSKKSPCYA